MRKPLHWEVIYTLKTTEELRIKYKGGKQERSISAMITLQSLRALLCSLLFLTKQISTYFFLFLTVLINPNSVTSALASSIHYVILKSTMIKALKALPLQTKKHHGD